MDNDTARKYLRDQIPDNDKVFGDDENEYLFSDDTLDGYLVRARGSILRAAGFANLAIASSEAMISKVIRTQDLTTNGAAVADALRAVAKELFALADAEEAAAARADEDFFYIIDYKQGWNREHPELTEWV
jgi:Arc/MetJ family transcription regulator